MALNVGPDFKQRWLDVPEAVRQVFIDDLSRICELLTPEANIQQWLRLEDSAQQRSTAKIEQAYAQRKAELIEAARIRKQQALEKALEQKRAEEQAYAEQLKRDEERRFQEQTQALAQISSSLAAENEQHLQRYTRNVPQNIYAADGSIQSELENLRLRLELEAETQIELQLGQLRQQLKEAAREEIEYLLENAQLAAAETDVSMN